MLTIVFVVCMAIEYLPYIEIVLLFYYYYYYYINNYMFETLRFELSIWEHNIAQPGVGRNMKFRIIQNLMTHSYFILCRISQGLFLRL